jgi:hypothetical protein
MLNVKAGYNSGTLISFLFLHQFALNYAGSGFRVTLDYGQFSFILTDIRRSRETLNPSGFGP